MAKISQHPKASVKVPKTSKGTPLTAREAMKIQGVLDKNQMTLGADWTVYHAPYLGGFGDPIPKSNAVMQRWLAGELTAEQVIENLRKQ